MKYAEWVNMEESIFHKKVYRAVKNNKWDTFIINFVKDLKWVFTQKRSLSLDSVNGNLIPYNENRAFNLMASSVKINYEYSDVGEFAIFQALNLIKNKFLFKPEKIYKSQVDISKENFVNAIFEGQQSQAITIFKDLFNENLNLSEIKELLYFFSIINIEDSTHRKARNLGMKICTTNEVFYLCSLFSEIKETLLEWLIGFLSMPYIQISLFDITTYNQIFDEKWATGPRKIDKEVFDELYEGIYKKNPISNLLVKLLQDNYSLNSIRNALNIVVLRFFVERNVETPFYFINLFNYLNQSSTYYDNYRNIKAIKALFTQANYLEIVLNERGGSGKDSNEYVGEEFDELVKEMVLNDLNHSNSLNYEFISSLINERKQSPSWADEYFNKSIEKSGSFFDKTRSMYEIFKKL